MVSDCRDPINRPTQQVSRPGIAMFTPQIADHRYPLGYLHRSFKDDLHGVTHVTRWEPYDLHDLSSTPFAGWVCTR